MIDRMMTPSLKQQEQSKKDLHAQACKTWRKLPLFGNEKEKVDFTWPTQDELLKFPADKPIQETKLKWKASQAALQCLGGFQIILSNGLSSPAFMHSSTNSTNMNEVVLTNNIKKLGGTKGDLGIREVIFQDAEGKNIGRIFTANSNFGPDQELEEGEEIVGIYGNNTGPSGCYSLGFIVWQPPKV